MNDVATLIPYLKIRCGGLGTGCDQHVTSAVLLPVHVDGGGPCELTDRGSDRSLTMTMILRCRQYALHVKDMHDRVQGTYFRIAPDKVYFILVEVALVDTVQSLDVGVTLDLQGRPLQRW